MLCLLLAASCLLQFAGGNDVRSRLYTKILMDYQLLMSPNEDTDPVHIDIALSIQHIGQVNEADGTVKVTFGLYQNWTDKSLAWNRSEYNISSLFLPRHIVWVPDTVLHKGVATQKTSSKDVLVFLGGQVADVNIIDVSLPCVKQKSKPKSKTSGDGSNEELKGKTRRVCTLTLGCALESHTTILYEAKPPDVTALSDVKDDWQLDTVYPYEMTQSRPSPHDPMAVAVFDFILIKNTTLVDTPTQLVAPSIMTSLVALGVFFLPPMAGERILMVGLAFLGQLTLAGFSVLAQIQSNDPGTLYNFMLFSTVYIFLIIVTVLSMFFVCPLLKRLRFQNVEDNTEEDGAQLLSISEKKFVSAIPDAIMFTIFITLYIVGIVTILFT